MTITLSSDLDRRVQEKLASGMYKSVDEVLSAALRALDEEEEAVEGIREGNADYEAGRYEDFEIADAEFRKKHGIPDGE